MCGDPFPCPVLTVKGKTIMKCKIKMKDRILPAEGSVSGDTGTCPECSTPGVMLSVVGGYVRAHTVAAEAIPENNPQPGTLVESPVKYGKGLKEPVMDLTDTGLRTGDPRAAAQRRAVEIESATGTGTVKVPRKFEGKGTTKSGKPRMTTKLVDVPATEEHVREALKYWKARHPRTPETHARQAEELASLYRRLEALSKGSEAVDAQMADKAGVLRGPALTRGRATAPRLRDPELPFDQPTDIRRNGQVRKSTTLDQPLGRERFDRTITDVPEPPRKRTPAERRRHRRMVAQLSRQSSGTRS